MKAITCAIILSLLDASAAQGGICVRVATDGSAPFTSVQTAVDAYAGASQLVTFSISGFFWERVHVPANFTGGVVFFSAAAGRSVCASDKTGCAAALADSAAWSSPGVDGLCPHLCAVTPADGVIAYNVSGSSVGTFSSASVQIDANDFTAVNMTFINNASDYNKRVAGQSVALYANGDRAALFGTQVWGGQDTLLTGSGRVHVSDSHVNGSCDSIFGYGSAVFERSLIDIYDTVTAQKGNGSTSYLFSACTIAPASPNGTFLGRPWGPLASTVYKNCYMSDGIEPAGWEDWGHGCTNHTSTWCNGTFYAEAGSFGPGSDPSARVWWSYQLNETEAALWNASTVLSGWVPSVPPPPSCSAVSSGLTRTESAYPPQ